MRRHASAAQGLFGLIYFTQMAVYTLPLPTPRSLCTEEGRWKDPESCSDYIDCIPDSDGQLIPHKGSCHGALYNQEKMACIEPTEEDVTCSQRSLPQFRYVGEDHSLAFICEGKPNGFYCADCKTLVNCIDGSAFPYTCDNMTRCDSRQTFGGGVCYPEHPQKCFCQTKHSFHVDLYDDRKFYYCEDVQAEYDIFQCPNEMIFVEDEIQCNTRSGLPRCRYMGIFSYIPDCRRYYVCILTLTGWVQKAFRCHSDSALGELMFNQVTGECEDPCTWTAKEFACQREGRFGDIISCRIYHECVAMPYGFRHVKHECPLGYTWDPTALNGYGLCVLAETNTGCVVDNSTLNLCIIPETRCPYVPSANSSFLLSPDEIEPPSTISVADILHNTETPVPAIPPETIPPTEYTTMPAETTTNFESLQNLEFSLQDDGSSSQCPQPFDLVAGDCVLVSGEDERRNYTGAMEYCGRLGAGLASPSNLMALRNYVLLQLGVIHVRVGATRSPELEGAWFWPDGRPVPSTAWGPWQPDNAGGQEYCTTLNTNLWWNGPLSDFSCNGLYAFVCQYGV
ncbi:uncharacterized protein LOC134766748 isoform X1 [Penaeus indicus]|uniref:uncharacterized protein LOC134766748 isoform X1 n=1 Tax=Penaeus indicus TaxID=29960 RepID=UPI00300C6896